MHEKSAMYAEGKYKCKIVSKEPFDPSKNFTTETQHYTHGFRTKLMHLATASACECRCDKHPTSCYKKGFVFSNPYIHGNIYQDMENKAACSQLCSHHPECKFWEFELQSKKCVLKSGEFPQIIPNPNPAVTTYAGEKAGTTGCIKKRPVRCEWGWIYHQDPVTEFEHCTECPVGKFTDNGINSVECIDDKDILHRIGDAEIVHRRFDYTLLKHARATARKRHGADEYLETATGAAR